MADEPLSVDTPIHARWFLAKTRRAHPDLAELVDEAEMAVAAAEALGLLWRHEFVVDGLDDPASRVGLRWRTGAFVVLSVQRAVELGDGLAREIEADALYPAMAVGRALAEVAALTCFARRQLPEAAATGDAEAALAIERLLLGSRYYPDLPKNHGIPELINAAREQLGDDFGSNYGWLSEHTHPNAPLVGAFQEDGAVTFDRRGMGRDRTESLVHLLGHGARIVAHNGSFLTDWANTLGRE